MTDCEIIEASTPYYNDRVRVEKKFKIKLAEGLKSTKNILKLENFISFKMKKLIALIPARKGSERVKDKNIQLINGKPLIFYSIRSAQKSKLFDRIIVSTDSKKYAKIAKKIGAEVPFIRPKAFQQNFL